MAATQHRWRNALLATLAVAGAAAHASGLQVAPVSVTIAPTQNADGLWLSNTSDIVVHAQVRVYQWTQDGGEDRLTASRGVVISPPMLELPPDGQQLIRTIRLGAPPAGPTAAEAAYRVIIDELPIDVQGRKGVNFVLRYSVPVFVEPSGAAPTPPQLSWSLQRKGATATLVITNTGGTHAQIANLAQIYAQGQHIEIARGLMGYVLPGATMHWAIKLPDDAPDTPGTWEAMVNGTTAIQSISLASSAP